MASRSIGMATTSARGGRTRSQRAPRPASRRRKQGVDRSVHSASFASVRRTLSNRRYSEHPAFGRLTPRDRAYISESTKVLGVSKVDRLAGAREFCRLQSPRLASLVSCSNEAYSCDQYRASSSREYCSSNSARERPGVETRRGQGLSLP